MTKNLFGNLSNSDDLNEKYQKANEENIRMETARKFDEEIEGFKSGKHDIVWASKFDAFSKNNQNVIKDTHINRYCKYLDIYETLLKEATKLIEEDNKRRQEYALQKARELQRQKEEEAKKRLEYVLDLEKRIISLHKNVKAEKSWVDSVLKVNSEYSVLSDEEKKRISEGRETLRSLLPISSNVSTALMCANNIHELEKAKRDSSFVKKYDELSGVVNNNSINTYLSKEALNIFTKLVKDYYEIKNESLVNNLHKLIEAAKKSSGNFLAAAIFFTDAEAALFLKIDKEVTAKYSELKVAIPTLDSDYNLVKDCYAEYVASKERGKVKQELERLKITLENEKTKTANYTSAEKVQCDKAYNDAVLVYNSANKSLIQKDLDSFKKYLDNYKKMIVDIENTHKRLASEAESIKRNIDNKETEIRSKFPASNYLANEKNEIDRIILKLRDKLFDSLYYKDGTLYTKVNTKTLMDETEKELARVKTAKQVKDNQIDQTFVMAQKGDAEAMYQLAELYFNGDGVTESPKEAVKWYERAAKKGHPKAIEKMGDCYYNGYGVPQSFKEAAKWYKKIN